MVKQSGANKTKTAYGVELDSYVHYNFDWFEFENFAELVAAGKTMDEAAQVKARNKQAKASADQKAKIDALKLLGHEKKTDKNDPQTRLRTMARLIAMGDGVTEEFARAEASRVLGIKWLDDEDDAE